MYTVLLILLQFILISNAQDHVFVRDYFVYKKVRNVVGFSCGDTIGKQLFRSLTPLLCDFLFNFKEQALLIVTVKLT